MAWLSSTRPIGRTADASRRHRNPSTIGFIAALLALSLVLSGCASSRDPTMARIFEAPNVIHVCVRPPNVSKDKRIWALTADGTPFFGVREVDRARDNGSPVYVFDEESPLESAKLLPIPYNELECPARTPPPKPRIAAAKAKAKEADEKKNEAEKAERSKPLPRPIPRDAYAVERRVEAQKCIAYEEPGQTRRRSSTGARTCARVLVHRARTEPVVAESPRGVEPPAPVRLSEEAAREYEDWGLEPADVSALAQDRARECLERICHARHQNFLPKGKKKPAEAHNGQSLSTGSGSGGGASPPKPAPETTVKTTTRPVPKPAGGAQPATAASTSRVRTPTKEQREAALARAKGPDGVERCTHCDTPLDRQAGKPHSAEIDHRKAFVKGGQTTDSNLDAACRTCNRSKGPKELGTEWLPPNKR